MPTFDYECLDCGGTFEKLLLSWEDKIENCPLCGSFQYRRLPCAPAGFQFKGAGFYANDYKDSNR